MIYVTTRAVGEIRALLKHSRASAGHVLRLAFDGKHGIAMGLGETAGDDVMLGDADGPVLAITPGLARRLDGLVFDWMISEVQGFDRGGFSFRPRLGEEPDLIPPASPPAGNGLEQQPQKG